MQAVKQRVVNFDEFMDALCRCGTDLDAIHTCLTVLSPDLRSCSRYLFFDPAGYTRNLAFRDSGLEVALMCWDVGHISPIHDHGKSMGYTLMLQGQLTIWNFKVIPAGCRPPAATQRMWGFPDGAMLAELDAEVATVGDLASFDGRDAIHRVGNISPSKGRAISINIYTPPIETYRVFDPESHSVRTGRTHSYSEFGLLTS